MKQLQVKPTAKQLRVLSYYSGDSGTYISVLPSADAIKKLEPLRQMIVDAGFDKGVHPALNWHVTVIHSKDELEDVAALHENMTLEADRVFDCAADYVTWWPGHNDKGYVVLKLRAPELAKLNAELRNLGLKVTFDDYEAHITLIEKALSGGRTPDDLNELVSKLNLYVIRNLLAENLQFTGIRLEDIKK